MAYLLLYKNIKKNFRYWNIKPHYNIFNSLSCLIVIASQLNYYYGYKQGIYPTFVRVFHSLSNWLTAKNVGLKHSDIKKVMQYKRIFRMMVLHNRFYIPILTFCVVFGSYALNENPINTIIYGLPNSIFLPFHGYYTSNIIIIQV